MIHFIGIGGIGVSALAQVAQARGTGVSGSDPNADPETNPAVARLVHNGARVYREHRAENIADDVELVVASAAIAEDNPELRAAAERGIPVVSRAEMLGRLMSEHEGLTVAVAGTHGKTTTTAMIGYILQEAGFDPTVFVGGEVEQIGGNVRVGSNDGPFIAEACEAYDSFLYLKPDIAVVTNVEADHLDHYGSFDNVLAAFRKFLDGVSPDGELVICADDPPAVGLVTDADRWRRIMMYGTAGSGQDYTTFRLDFDGGTTFGLALENRVEDARLAVPGLHNVRNAVAAATVCDALGVKIERIVDALGRFQGAGRRQEILGVVEAGNRETIMVMDDYAHHPTEIRATIAACRASYPKRRFVAIFQPHLYSRTRDFLPEFASALAEADIVLVTDIYAARESPIPGVRAADIVNRAHELNAEIPIGYVPDKNDLPAMTLALLQPGDLALFLGAGDIREQGERLVKLLFERWKATI